MKAYYHQTKDYWNQVFDQAPAYDPTQPLPFEALEEALSWLCEGSESVIDFGCGYGKSTLRCLSHGAHKVCGMDIAASAIDMAQHVAESYQLGDQSEFICAGVQALRDIPDDTYDAVLLFNIVDNLLPLDALSTLRQMRRILKPEGKLLIKLNPKLSKEELDENDIKQVGEHIYQESSGLYIWNLSDKQWRAVLETHFHIERYEPITLAPHPVTQRLFYLKNKV